jgi:hypothetical protein
MKLAGAGSEAGFDLSRMGQHSVVKPSRDFHGADCLGAHLVLVQGVQQALYQARGKCIPERRVEKQEALSVIPIR